MSGPLTDGLVAPGAATGTWERLGWAIGTEVSAPAADEVDRAARFPSESVDAFRDRGLLGALVPEDLGGGGADLGAIAGTVRGVAYHCASSALVLAMHSMEVYHLVRHGRTDYLRDVAKRVATDGLLVANAGSEVGVGGDHGRSLCCLEESGGALRLDKHVLAISYGADADLIAVTARRSPDAPETDQVLALCHRGEATLDPISTWDTLGLRGTCSMGFHLTASLTERDLYPVPFGVVANDGGVQARQILLSAVWVGLAEAAAAKAHDFVRAAARRTIGTTPPGALRLAELAADLQQARSLLVAAITRYESLHAADQMENAGFVVSLKNLKISTATLATRVAATALDVCGIAGYKKDSPYSLDRVIRDAYGGMIMVSNDRYYMDNARLLLARKEI